VKLEGIAEKVNKLDAAGVLCHLETSPKFFFRGLVVTLDLGKKTRSAHPTFLLGK
jgi:hypothetical protein